MAITPTSSDSSTELSGKVDSPAVFDGGDADSVSGEEVEEEVEVEEDGDEEEDPEEVLEEEEEEEGSEDGDEADPEEVLEEEDEEEVKEDGVEDAPEEVAEEEEEEEGGEDGEEEEEGEEDDDDPDPVEEEEVVEEEIEDVEEEEVEEVEMEIAEEEEEVAEENGEEPMEEDEEEAEVADEDDDSEEEEEQEEKEEEEEEGGGEEEIDADGDEEEVEEAEEVKGGQEGVREVLEEDNVKVEDDIGKKVDVDVVREELKEGEVIKEEEEMKDMEGDGAEGCVVEEEVKQEDEVTKGGEEDVKVEDVGEKVDEEDCGEGQKECTGLPIVDTRDISAKIDPEGLGGPNSFSCTPERCNPSTTVAHVKDGNVGNLTASNPSDETGSGAQMEEDVPTESLKDVEQAHDSHIGLVSRDSVAGQYTRLDQENNTSLEKENEHCDVLEIEAPHLHTKTDLQTREGSSLPSMHTLEKRPRSSSPDAVIKHANKRPAIICDFFARGWCIKGKSCSFLHQKEGVSNTSLQTKDVAGVDRNGGFLHGSDILYPALREDVDRSKRSVSQELLSNTESSSKSPLTAQKDLVRAYGEDFELPKLHYDYNMHGAHPQSRRASYAPSDDFRQPFSREEYKRPFGPTPRIDVMDERRLAGDNLLSGRYPTSHFPSQDSRTSYSLTSSLRAPTHGFTRMGAEHLDACMPSDFDRGNYGYRSASLTKTISSYCSTSEVPHAAQKDVPLAGKMAEVRDAWVPSIPFRSSFCRDPTNIPSYRSQYDPVLDSITPFNVAKSTFETIQNVTNGGTTPSGIHTPGYGAQQSINSFSQHHEAVFGKSKVDRGLNGSAGTSATPEPSTVDGGSNFMSKKDEHWIPGHAADGVNVNDVEASLGGDMKNIEDKGRNNKDSRAMKFFHCALVDFVKELVKPSWREGHLSKDAHKMVVKKAVEKVLSAIQPHQVPGNAELVNQYLSTSRSKILKLVEGYVEKYSKTGAS